MKNKEARERIARAMEEEGKSLRQISRALGMGRRRLRRVLGPPGEQGRSPKEETSPPPRSGGRPSKLDTFRERIRELALRKDRIGRKELRLSLKQILQTIRKEGYEGGRTILGEYVREIRGSEGSRKAFARYEPAPGLESQSDWSPYTVSLGGKKTKVHIFSLILSYSRFQYVEAFTNEGQDALIQGHVEAFTYMMGLSAKILYDNQSPVVSCRIAGVPLLHQRFKAFSEHYGFQPKVGIPYQKERRGRVERPFGYLETSFFPGRDFDSLEDLRAQLRSWLEGEEDETGNYRIHGTTRRRPVDMWKEERDLLIELPPADFLPTRVEERLVAKDCTISVLGNRYTVPPRHVGKKVTVLTTPKDVKVFDSRRELVAVHRVPEGKGNMVIDEAHYEEIRRARHHVSVSVLEGNFLSLYPGQEAFLHGLQKRLRSIAPIHLRRLGRLREHFTSEQLSDALREAEEHGVFTSTYVEEVLRRRYPSQVGFHRFDENLEKPKGFRLGDLELGESGHYDQIFKEEKEDDRESE